MGDRAQKQSKEEEVQENTGNVRDCSENIKKILEEQARAPEGTGSFLKLGLHLLGFSHSASTHRIFLHLHEQGTAECTSICKELAYCTTNGDKPVRRSRGGCKLVCTQCGTEDTPLWRKVGTTAVCNACGCTQERTTD